MLEVTIIARIEEKEPQSEYGSTNLGGRDEYQVFFEEFDTTMPHIPRSGDLVNFMYGVKGFKKFKVTGVEYRQHTSSNEEPEWQTIVRMTSIKED